MSLYPRFEEKSNLVNLLLHLINLKTIWVAKRQATKPYESTLLAQKLPLICFPPSKLSEVQTTSLKEEIGSSIKLYIAEKHETRHLIQLLPTRINNNKNSNG